MDVQALADRVSRIESVSESVTEVIKELAADVRAMRNEGGGALQQQLDRLAQRMDASAQKLAAAVAAGTAADHELHDTDHPSAGAGDDGGVGGEFDGDFSDGDEPKIAQTDKGAAQAAADYLNNQNEPK